MAGTAPLAGCNSCTCSPQMSVTLSALRLSPAPTYSVARTTPGFKPTCSPWVSSCCRTILAFICFVFSAAFSLALLGFLIMHARLILTNHTTIEAYEKRPVRCAQARGWSWGVGEGWLGRGWGLAGAAGK